MLVEADAMPTQSLWRDRPFVLFWLGRTISVAGTTVSQTVLPPRLSAHLVNRTKL